MIKRYMIMKHIVFRQKSLLSYLSDAAPCRIGSKLRDLVILPYRSLSVDLTAPARSAARRIDFANI
jgi:hypothetical protein